MNKVLAMIPLKDGHAISNNVLKGLIEQSDDVIIDLLPATRPKFEEKEGIHHFDHQNRELMRKWVLEFFSNYDYYLSLNRDVILEKNNVKDMINF